MTSVVSCFWHNVLVALLTSDLMLTMFFGCGFGYGYFCLDLSVVSCY